MKKTLFLMALGFYISLLSLRAQTAATENFLSLRASLNETILDLYEGKSVSGNELDANWRLLNSQLHPAAASLPEPNFKVNDSAALAEAIGQGRGELQHIAAIEMLTAQQAGEMAKAQSWRAIISLPRYADPEQGALLLQQPMEKMRDPAVSRVLAREYISWQVMRTRQLLDLLQHDARDGAASDASLRERIAEITALTEFPGSLLAAAGLPAGGVQLARTLPQIPAPYNSDAATRSLAEWRDQVEANLPNLLTDSDVNRLERLLARFVKLVPKEYKNGVKDGEIIIALEHREATQFAEQAQELSNELAPVWRATQPKVYADYHVSLLEKLEDQRQQVARLASQDAIDSRASEISSILGDKFGLTARTEGDKSKVIEETALEVRSNLNSSLAAALSDHWEEAESLRMEAYTAFDSEIEARVLPRNPELAMRAERCFIDGNTEQQGVKALLDRRAPVDELTAGYEKALSNMDECVALLQVSVSPATIGYTAFTILAREGLEAVVILSALLAGLRGEENAPIRRGVCNGAWLALLATGLTFVLSRTIIQSLSHYGERLEAVVSLLAVIVLLMVTNWVFHKYYWSGWNTKLRQLARKAVGVRETRWEGAALLGVGFLTVYREGFETTLFMQSLLLEGSRTGLWTGVAAGVIFIATIGTLIFKFGMKLPYRKMLVITGLLVVSILVSFTGSAVRLFQVSGWLPVHPVPGLTLPNWVGLWFGLYPSWEGLLIPPLGLVYVGAAWLYTKWKSHREQTLAEMEAAKVVTSRLAEKTKSPVKLVALAR